MLRERIFDDRRSYLDRFGWVLFLTALAVISLALVNLDSRTTLGLVASLLAIIVVGTTLLIALRASGLRRRLQRIADVVVILAVLVNATYLALEIVGAVQPSPVATGRSLSVVVLVTITPVVMVRRLLRHRRVTNGTLLGAISVYLLIPLAYFYVFLAVDAAGGPFFGQSKPTTSFMYFSLTTVTTLGYGDLTPVSAPGRLLATSEAVLGQVYLVTFVAMLVGLRAQHLGDHRNGDLTGGPSDDA